MASRIAWLDYSEDQRRRMREVIDLFREHDTLDELGIGSIRDTFSDLLFPGRPPSRPEPATSCSCPGST